MIFPLCSALHTVWTTVPNLNNLVQTQRAIKMVRGYSICSTAQDEGTLLTIDKRLIKTALFHSTMETTDRMEQSSLMKCTVKELIDSIPRLKQERPGLDGNAVYTAYYECA